MVLAEPGSKEGAPGGLAEWLAQSGAEMNKAHSVEKEAQAGLTSSNTGRDEGWFAASETVRKVGLDDFDIEVMVEDRPVLLACMHLSPELGRQTATLGRLAKAFGGALKYSAPVSSMVNWNCWLVKTAGGPVLSTTRIAPA